jgi:hypothetical protein
MYNSNSEDHPNGRRSVGRPMRKDELEARKREEAEILETITRMVGVIQNQDEKERLPVSLIQAISKDVFVCVQQAIASTNTKEPGAPALIRVIRIGLPSGPSEDFLHLVTEMFPDYSVSSTLV